MKLLYVLLVVSIFVAGCKESIYKLNWNETARQQNLKIGDMITVEGVVYENVRKFSTSTSGGSFRWQKDDWEPKIHAFTFNPDEPDDADHNPNDAIGVVICTIYNPKAYEDLQRVDDMYLDRYKSFADTPELKHRIKFVGTIYSFERYLMPMYREPDVYLQCARIHVSDLEIINSTLIPKPKTND